MNGVWRKIWPECTATFTEVDDVPLVRAEIVDLAQEAHFEGLDEADFDEILNVEEDFDVSTADLIEMAQNIYENDDNSVEVPEVKQLTTKGMGKAIKLISEALEIFVAEDPDADQSAKVTQAVEASISCYKKIYLDKKQKAVQITLNNFIIKQPKEKQTPNPEPTYELESE